MKSYKCPNCGAENSHDFSFHVAQYVCKGCHYIIDVGSGKVVRRLQPPKANVALKVGQKGKLYGKNYTVASIVVKNYGNSVFWREYYLRDDGGNPAFLSETDGHWVLLFLQNNEVTDMFGYAEFKNKRYRRYETTPCTTYAGEGFFEDEVPTEASTYKEYVNGTEMVSIEIYKGNKEYFQGSHIPKSVVKRAFGISEMPNYYGIGIVQPFYFNIRQMLYILGVTGILLSLLQLNMMINRQNKFVFSQKIPFREVKDKELVSNSFKLSGGSAPMEVSLSSQVDNSWASVQLTLVNEETNEHRLTSKDIEYYHGYEDGESWSEGSSRENLNFCGVPSGTYHFLVSAEKENSLSGTSTLSSPSKTYSYGDKMVSISSDGLVNVTENNTGKNTTYSDISMYRLDSVANVIDRIADSTAYPEKYKNSNPAISQTENSVVKPQPTPEIPETNPDFEITAKWLPVSFWNYGIAMILLVLLGVALYYWRYYFQVSKWSNSDNSPYQKNN